jgi:hypothetical protein
VDQFIAVLRDSLETISDPRYFESERGYQGALLTELAPRIKGLALPNDPMIEQEYQKRLPVHGISIRPDIIVHVPFKRGHSETRQHGNFVAIELKRRATSTEADEDFASLKLMVEKLNYPLAVFINIDSRQTHSERCPREIAGQAVCFAVFIENGNSVVTVQRP